MEKTYKEIRQDLAHKYHDGLREVEGILEFLGKSGYSKKEIKATRKRLISNLQSNLQKEEGYDESKKSHRAEHKAKGLVGKAKEEKERLKREYEEKMAEADKDIVEKVEAYENAQIDYRGKIEEEIEVKDTNGELYGDKENILASLKENCVKVEENVLMMGYRGKKVHINLPEIKGKFEGFKFEYFVSSEEVMKRDVDHSPQLVDKSYSMKEVGNLLKAMNRYMQAMGVETDGDMDYENGLKSWKTKKYRCEAGDCLQKIAGLHSWYWLKDNNVDGKRDPRVLWYCLGGNCHFSQNDNIYNVANLFLRLS